MEKEDQQVYTQLRRFIIIYDLLSKNHYTKRDEFRKMLIDKLEHFADRTFERDIYKLKTQFDIPIRFKNYFGYYIDDDRSYDTKRVESLMHLVDSTIFKLKNVKTDGIVFPFTADNGQGNEFLYDIIHAISKKYKIKIVYKDYWKQKKKEYEISPYLLKEYNLRWYVLGKHGKKLKLYGLDRIIDLEVLENTKAAKTKISTDIFKNIIGVSESHLEREKVVLKFTARQGRYIKSAPWHSSQKIISDNEEGLTISLKVGINWELKEEIKKNGMQVKVLEPQHLVDEIKKELIANLAQYDS